MGKFFLFGALAMMLIAAGVWAARLRSAKEGDALPAIKSIALFIAAGVVYPFVCVTSNEFALSGFVHHEGFVVIAAMMFLPLIGVGFGSVAILIALYLKKLRASTSEKVQ